MKLNKQKLIGATALTLLSGVSTASPFIIDQHNDGAAPNQGYTTGFGTLGQSFSPTANALDHVELQLNAQSSSGGTSTVHVDILDAVGGNLLGSSNSLSFTGSAIQLGHFEFSAINISAYSSLFLSVIHDSGVNAGAFLAGGFGLNSYAGGQAYLSNAPCCNGFQPDSDLWFRTGYSTSAVPVPAAAWLFGSGLIGLVGLTRRKSS